MIAYVTRDADTTFKVKRSKVKGHGHQAALLTVALTRQIAAAWERIDRGNLLLRCGLHSAGAVDWAARDASAPTEGGKGRRHIVAAACLQLVESVLMLLGKSYEN